MENSLPGRLANVIVRDDPELNTTVPLPTAQFADVLELDHDPPKVQVPLPIRKYAVGLAIDVSPAMLTMEGAPLPSRIAAPESVSVPAAVSPLAEDVPIVIVPAACVMLPLTAKLNVPIANVPAQPVVSSETSAAFWSTVMTPPPEFPSKNTRITEVGAIHPPTPPDDGAQWAVCDQLPEPPIQ